MKDKNYKGKNNFVPEYFLWMEPDELRRRADELNKMTKRKAKDDGAEGRE